MKTLQDMIKESIRLNNQAKRDERDFGISGEFIFPSIKMTEIKDTTNLRILSDIDEATIDQE